ncbi:MAG: hypothetical protein QXT28_11625 [Thermofilaceae archaeon]
MLGYVLGIRSVPLPPREAADAEKLLAAVGEAFELLDSIERGVFSV